MAYTQEISLSEDNMESYAALFGLNDKNIRIVESECQVNVSLRNDTLSVSGEKENVTVACEAIRKLIGLIRRNDVTVDQSRIRYIVSLAKEGKAQLIDEMLFETVATTYRGKPVKPKTIGQQEYVKAIAKHDLTFAVGPAGTGKTYLAMALAVVALKNKEVERIILTRPAVEAGEKLGFLPGDMNQKVDPYLRPLYDALYDFLGADSYAKLSERGTIEVAPLAYMRGRTLSGAFIILDEAQNTTSEQMKMFLTRFGFGSKVVVTGDITQTDLPAGKKSGLAEALEVLKEIPEIAMVYLSHKDVVRHELVAKITYAYDEYSSRGRVKGENIRNAQEGNTKEKD